MMTNELIEDQLKMLNTFLWCELLAENPLHLEDFTSGQLGRLLSKARKEKGNAEMFAAFVNPPLDPQRQHSGWIQADSIERLVLAELERRQVLTAEPMPPAQVAQETAARKAPAVSPDLLSLEDAVEDAAILSKVWRVLAAQGQPEPPALTFERLFIGTPEMETAVKAVEGTDFEPKKRPHIRAFYEASVTCNLIKDKKGKERRALPLIAEYFGASCHGNAAYQVDADKKMIDVLVRRMQKEREKSVKT